MGHNHHTPHPPTFRGSEWELMVQMYVPISPKYLCVLGRCPMSLDEVYDRVNSMIKDLR